MNFAQMAQDFVEATSALVGGRTINIMDIAGIIVASTEQHRIGDFHKGASEVIETKRMVMIYEHNEKDYPGSKKGCNMPIMTDGSLVGVVGVFGEPDTVMEIANLLRVYVAQYFQQKFQTRRQRMETEARTQLLDILLSGREDDRRQIMQLSNVIQVTLQFPLQVVIFSIENGRQEHNLNRAEELERTLLSAGIVRPHRDVYGMQNRSYVLVCRDMDFCSSFKEILKNHPGYRISIGGRCQDYVDIVRSYEEAMVLGSLVKEPISNIRNRDNKIKYLFHCMTVYTGGWYVEELYQRLAGNTDRSSINTILETAGVYYEEAGSVAKAAERLHVHKNTLLYRMNQLFRILGMEEEKAFTKEFFIRLILEMY